MRYPLVPKSTSPLRPGQFWAVPLRDGRFACGRVLQLGGEENPVPTRAFFGALHSWVGETPPRETTPLGADLVDFGLMHIRAIVESGGCILGERPLAADRLEVPLLLSAHGGEGTSILRGAAKVRAANSDEWGRYPVLAYWGKDFIQALANEKLGSKVA